MLFVRRVYSRGYDAAAMLRYRLLRSFFAMTLHWRDHDPFSEKKLTTFSQSGRSILNIAATMHKLENEPKAQQFENLDILFKEMVQTCLWYESDSCFGWNN